MIKLLFYLALNSLKESNSMKERLESLFVFEIDLFKILLFCGLHVLLCDQINNRTKCFCS